MLRWAPGFATRCIMQVPVLTQTEDITSLAPKPPQGSRGKQNKKNLLLFVYPYLLILSEQTEMSLPFHQRTALTHAVASLSGCLSFLWF